MIRDSLAKKRYWDYVVNNDKEHVVKAKKVLMEPAKNPIYRPQFTLNLSMDIFGLALRCYSRGDPISDIIGFFGDVIKFWEVSNKFSEEVCISYDLKSCRGWVFELSNINHYNWCFWLVGLAMALDVPDEQWQRLLVLIGGEGEDVLLDRIIATRQENRRIGTCLLHNKPYFRLLKAIDAPKEKQAYLLSEFVKCWYSELSREGDDELWWYTYGDPKITPLEMGCYFGRWCLEAVAAVKAFGIDDSQCLGHENYPGDLLRASGPTTHPARHSIKIGWVQPLFGKKSLYQ